jgi:hypothetical protein
MFSPKDASLVHMALAFPHADADSNLLIDICPLSMRAIIMSARHPSRINAISCRHGKELACDHASRLTLDLPGYPSQNLKVRGFTV